MIFTAIGRHLKPHRPVEVASGEVHVQVRGGYHPDTIYTSAGCPGSYRVPPGGVLVLLGAGRLPYVREIGHPPAGRRCDRRDPAGRARTVRLQLRHGHVARPDRRHRTRLACRRYGRASASRR